MPFDRRLYCREWVAKRRKDFFFNKCCAKCNSTERLELHHIDPSTKIANSIWSWSETRRLEEIAKCEVLCHNCHVIETRKQLGYRQYSHGTTTCYSETLCRCQLCRRAMAEYKRQWRISTGKH